MQSGAAEFHLMFVLIAAHRGAVVTGLSWIICEVSFAERLKLLSEAAKVLLKRTAVTVRHPQIH